MIGERDEILKELETLSLSFSDDFNSKNFYNGLEKVNNFSAYKENCKRFLDGTRRCSAVINTCAKLLYYLKNNQISNKENAQYDVCPLLNYWVYNKLSMILNSYYSSELKIAFGKIVLIWNTFIQDRLKEHENETCKPDTDLVLYDDWRERKNLYEYYVDYSSISNTLVAYKQWCEDFYKYVESKKPLYKHFKERCLSRDTKRCPKFYEQCLQYDPEIVLPHRDCPEEIMKKRAAAALTVPQLRNGLLGSEPNSEVTDGRMKTFDPPILSGKSHTADNVGNILLGVVATTMTSGALYRFTPLGGMIRNGLGWNNNNMRNFNGGDIGLYDYASEPFNPYTGSGEEHIIGYHPA
ncbi:PIR protein [Plasmodium vivax]|uniref:VIR protein n=1 Tax=Plasmodium vivax TaxID=5855 RepID=A0A564ZUW9_PLAVI|nr:PIR protein [Plasmodium vivax]VUZ95006.1 PIR protein [Plasmodium vivax]